MSVAGPHEGVRELLGRLLPLLQASLESRGFSATPGPTPLDPLFPLDTMLAYIYDAGSSSAASSMEVMSAYTTGQGAIVTSAELRLAQWIKREVEEEMKPLIRAEVQQQCQQTSLTQEKMRLIAPAILSKLLQSEEFNSCATR